MKDREKLDRAEGLPWGSRERVSLIESVLASENPTYISLMRAIVLLSWGAPVRGRAIDALLDMIERETQNRIKRHYALRLAGSRHRPGLTNYGGARWRRARTILEIKEW